MFDADGRISFVNGATERLLGMPRKSLIGRRFDDPAFGLTGADGTPGSLGSSFEEASAGRGPAGPVTLGLARSDGTRLTVAARVMPLLEADGTLAETVASLRDVTAEGSLAAEREARLEETRRVARLLAEESSPLDAAQGLLAEFARAWPVVSATLYITEGDGARLLAEWTAPGLAVDKPRSLSGDDLARLLEPVRSGRPVRRSFERRITDPATYAAMVAAGSRSDLLIPIVDGRLGVLVAADTRELAGLTPAEQRDLAEFGRIAAGVIRRAGRHSSAADDEARRRIRELLASPERFQPVFQPIVELATGRIAGYELLARFAPDISASPGPWFAAAARAGLAGQLEALPVARARQLVEEEQLPPGSFLSVNVSPALLDHPSVVAALDGAGLERLVIEMTENEAVQDYPALRNAMVPYRARGARLAIDDAGAGYASLRHVVELRPDFVKLDADLIVGLRDDEGRQGLVRALQGFADEIGFSLVAEGVEQREDLVLLAEKGNAAARPGLRDQSTRTTVAGGRQGCAGDVEFAPRDRGWGG